MKRTILVVVPDLFFAARIREVAGASGTSVREADAARAAEVAREIAPAVAIVDLHGAGDAVPALRAALPELRIVGFHSHVDTAVRDAALAAGADQVLPRSAFTRRLAELLRDG